MSHPVLTIDSVFVMTDSFHVSEMEPDAGIWTNTNPKTGNTRVYSSYFKDHFQLGLSMTEAQMMQFKQIAQAVGVNAVHVLQYDTDTLTRLYDGATSPAGVINIDVNRIRGKIRFEPCAFPHIDFKSDFYKVVVECFEV